jgi:hypothetical protein
MKRALLRSVAALMVACMFVLTGGGFTMGEVEVAINDGFTEFVVEGIDCCEKEQQIIAALNGEELMTLMSILCIFGHSTAKGTAIGTQHRYYSSAPRCLRTNYDVTYCTRSGCNYTVYTQTGQVRIYCCS